MRLSVPIRTPTTQIRMFTAQCLHSALIFKPPSASRNDRISSAGFAKLPTLGETH